MSEGETVMFLSPGFETVNSPPPPRLASLVRLFANSLIRNEKWICEVVEPLWCLLREFWSLMVSSGKVFQGFSLILCVCSNVLDGPACVCSNVLDGPACSLNLLTGAGVLRILRHLSTANVNPM